jgi:methylamine---glutamate N-methyltransferase subunit B
VVARRGGRVSAVGSTAGVELDVEAIGVRAVNRRLHEATDGETFTLGRPAGRHALAAGMRVEATIDIAGHAGYYCAGMNQRATVRVHGNVGVGVAENMMSGRVEVMGDAGQSAAATAHGGALVVRGNAAARCAISLKGADVVVSGSVGHATAFMAQSGRLLILGDAGPGLGDSIYEARIYLLGTAAGLGADCVEKAVRDEHLAEIAELLDAAGITGVDAGAIRRYGSARQLYHWQPGRDDAL